MKIAVLDTSALVRLYVPDGPLPYDLEEYLNGAWKAEISLIIPELALAEFAQVLWKKEQAGYLDAAEVDEIIEAFFELPLEIIGHHEILLDALALSRSYKLTVYDAIFLSLARYKRAQLITADQWLKNAFDDIQSKGFLMEV
jgi:predicted nucleic acid-binding protein